MRTEWGDTTFFLSIRRIRDERVKELGMDHEGGGGLKRCKAT